MTDTKPKTATKSSTSQALVPYSGPQQGPLQDSLQDPLTQAPQRKSVQERYAERLAARKKQEADNAPKLPKTMVAMPKEEVVIENPKSPGQFRELGDDREMLFGSTTTKVGNGPAQKKPMEKGAIFGLDDDGNLMNVDVSETHEGVTTRVQANAPEAYTSGGGFKEASKAAKREQEHDGHSLIRSHAVDSGTVIDGSGNSSAIDAKNPRVALDWGRHDPLLNKAKLSERLTKGAMVEDDPNGAATSTSSQFSSFGAYNKSFDKVMAEVSRRKKNMVDGTGGDVLGQNGSNLNSSQKFIMDHGEDMGQFVQTTAKAPGKHKSTDIHGNTGFKKRKLASAVSPMQDTQKTQATVNIGTDGTVKLGQHFPVLPTASEGLTASDWGGPGPSASKVNTLKLPNGNAL